MSVERAIHELWGADFGLTSLVPAERVFTGSACGAPDLPYVVLTRHESRPIARTSSGRWLEETAVRLAVWSPGLDEAKRIGAEIDRRFDRKSFEQAGVMCLNMRRTK